MRGADEVQGICHLVLRAVEKGNEQFVHISPLNGIAEIFGDGHALFEVGAQGIHQLLVALLGVELVGALSYRLYHRVAEFGVHGGDNVLPLLFGVAARVAFDVVGKLFLEHSVKIVQFHLITCNLLFAGLRDQA